jgi:diaminopimelate epimerase
MMPAFTKMQGLGNDFVVLDAIHQTLEPTPAWIRRVADRRYGVGCDQVLVAAPARRPDADFRYRIWNADGQEVEHCGNGVRCMARFLHDQGLHARDTMRLETNSGLTRVERVDERMVRVDMGPPVLAPAEIPFEADTRQARYPLTADGTEYAVAAVSMGNPHVVLRVDDIDTAPVATLGPILEAHRRFPNRANAGFLAVTGRDAGRLRVYERGVGETPACGTGACAAVVAGILNDWFDPTVTLQLTGGALVIHWQGDGHPVWMTGPADTVFEGRLATGAP